MTRGRMHRLAGALLLALALALPAAVQAGSPERPAQAPAATSMIATPPAAPAPPASPVRNGREIYTAFRDGLADRECAADASERWRAHFAHVPRQMAANDDILPLFGYVVDALREAHLPTEYALIPFVESGYRPGARSAAGPAGLWQFIAVTARNHEIPIRPGYDGRLSPVESTRAAVRYLKTLHGMFAGDWRLAVMGYNAGEYRVFGALKRAGQQAMDATPETLAMPATTHAYVRKLHALSCLILEAESRDSWMAALDRPVPILQPITVPGGIGDLDTLASRHETDAALLRRLNPAHADGRIARIGQPLQVLVPKAAAEAPVFLAEAPPEYGGGDAPATGTGLIAAALDAAAARVHTVVRGDSASAIARRYGISTQQLLRRNNLDVRSVLRPGMQLHVDDGPAVP
ncbi:transglycosylase SLT domain-containing protein [Luteimonas sp. BDR2-5]|uniref:lytic transglycosylase domain-containing protein n=1 Tax=Proluteimonas luteida TaxID=2878685 RepID=UPI001E4A410E|nr:lytic transglycosylase domain-containing protein [Luteimonas sp. BDR2-5]MCD9027704.1 transglycosylase SLT domain-containing protein [Luteimonas sp. BDR2-5]